jgi:hypothetical protein
VNNSSDPSNSNQEQGKNILFAKASDVLSSPAKDFHCMILDGKETKNKEEIKRIINIYMGSVKEEGISGFSEDIDSAYDPFSCYFVSYNNNNDILCFVRIVFKNRGTNLPLESGTIADKDYRHVVNETNSVELTTFWAKDFYAFEQLLRTSIVFLFDQNIQKVYSTKELGEKKLNSVYRRLGLKRNNPPLENIYYQDYGRYINGALKPIIWEIYEGERKRLEYLKNKLVPLAA